MRILITANTMWNIFNFRKNLIHSLLKLGHEIYVVAPFDDYEIKISDIGCKIINLHMHTTSVNPFSAAACIIQFYKITKSIKPDIILSFTIKNNIFCGISTRITSIPFIPNVTGLGTSFLSGKLLAMITKLLYRVAFKHTKIVFFQNSSDQELFVKLKIVNKVQANLIPGSGIDLNEYQEIPLQNNIKTTVLMVSRIIKDKGVNEFLEASRQVKMLYPQCQFVLLGQYDEHDQRKIDVKKLNDWCKDGIGQYIGFSDNVRDFLCDATLVVLPSYREGLPRVILEAAATGRACITSDAPGCRDAVEDGKTGLLCYPGSANSLSNKIIDFLELPFSKKLKMGKRARTKMEQEFSDKIIAKKYIKAIEKLIYV